MARFLKQIAILLLLFLAATRLFAEDSCVSPTDSIVLNATLKNQEIDKPFVVGESGGEALYYKIVLASGGRLVINTETDTYNGANAIDTVDTHGRLLKSDCSNLDINDTEISTNPRYFKFDKNLEAGTYYLRVHNEVVLNDAHSDLAKGFFQLENSFTPTAPSKDFSITKTSATTINSGGEIIYTIRVTNEGNDPTTSVKIIDPQPTSSTGNHLSYIDKVDSVQWSCTGTNPVECTLNSGVMNSGDTQVLKLKYKADYQTYDRDASNTTSVRAGYSVGADFTKDADERTIHIRKAIPSINITKDGPDSVVEGEVFDFDISVENNGTRVTDTDVVVTGTISSDFDIVDIIYDTDMWKDCSYDASKNYSCKLINDLAPWDIEDFKIRVKAVGDPSNPDAVLHPVVVNADTVMGHVTDSDSKRVTIIDKNPAITIAKTASEPTVTVGHNLSYTIAVQNSGNTPLTNVNITDNVPSSLTLINISGSGWDCSSSDIATNKVDCTLNILNTGANSYIVVEVKGKTVANGVVNRADVTTVEGVTGNDTQSIDVVAQITGIRIQKIAPLSVNPLQTFEYRLEVDNHGAESNSNIVVTDTIDSHLTLTSDWNSENVSPWSCSNSGKNITCNYAGVLEGSNASAPDIVIKVQAPYDEMTIDNTAVVNAKSGNELVPVEDNSTVSTHVNKPVVGHTVMKTTNRTSVKSGGSYRYTVRVTNDGTLTQSDIVVVDNIADLLKDSFTIHNGNFDCSESVGQAIKCKLDTLEGGDSESFTIDIVAPAVSTSTVVINEVNSTAKIVIPSRPDEVETSNSSVSVTINPDNSNLSITKDSSQDKVLEKDVFNYLISVKNNSISDEYNLTITDDIYSDLTSTTPAGCTKSGTVISCEKAELKAGESWDINITVKAPDSIDASKTITNIAKVVSSKDTTGESARKDIMLISSSSALELYMVSNPSKVYVNDEYYYSLYVNNNSDADINSVHLEDVLPTELEYVGYWSQVDGFVCNYDNGTRVFSCDNNGTFKVGEKSVDIYVKAPNFETNVTNPITVTTSLDANIREANATTQVEGKSAKLIFSKAQSDKNVVKVGDDFTYTLRVKNDGVAPNSDVNATNLKIAFDLDANVTYQSHSTIGWSCSFSAPTLSCTLPLLELGEESPDINVTVQGAVAKQAISNATLTAKELPSSENASISVDVREVVNLDMSLEVSDTPDPAEANSIYYYDFLVKNLDSAKTAKDIVVDINTTSVDDYILVSYSDNSDWDCTKVSTLLTCKSKHDLLAGADEMLKVEVKAPNSVTKIELNATVYSIFVNDINLANNSVSEDTSIIKTDLTSQNPREFTKVPLQGMVDMNIFGDLLTVGNQSICEKDSSGKCQEPSYSVNDLVEQKYANYDLSYAGAYKTATNAKLNIDASDEIVWAGLYWMGRIDKTIPGYRTKMENAHKVYLRADLNTSGYIEVEAQRAADAIDNDGKVITVDKFNFINGSSYFDYQGMADVTAYVKANRGDNYWVADIQSSEGENISAGWNLVVIVRDTKVNPTRELKNITIFDGFQGVWKAPDGMTNAIYKSEVNQIVKGFLTPTTGAIKSSLIFFGFEGDRTLSDFVKVSDSTGAMYSLSNAKNPADDAVNGTITKNGTTVTSRVPNLDNTSGIDIDEFDLGDIDGVMGTGIIDNGQTEASISIGSLGMVSNNNGGDRFFLGMFGFSINLNDPMCYMQKLKNASFTADLGDSAQIGEEIGIEVEFHNKEIQTLYNMHGYSQINKIFKEDNSSFEFKNIGEASYTPQNSLFKFGTVNVADDNLTEVTTSIGAGATSSSGGQMKTGESVFIHYNVIISDTSDDNLTNNIYSVSYEPNPNKKVQVSRCSGEDQTLYIRPNKTQGFEITHKGGITDGYSDDINSGDVSHVNNERHLFTQVQDKTFDIDIVALDDKVDNKVADKYRGLIRVELVDMSDFNGTLETCKNLSPLSPQSSVLFNGHIGENRKTISFSSDNAYENVGFRVYYLVDRYNKHVWKDSSFLGGMFGSSLSLSGSDLTKVKTMLDSKPYGDDERCKTECSGSDEDACLGCVYRSKDIGGLANISCSADRFVIKPKKITMSTTTANLLGGKDYNLTLDANATGYHDHNITLGTDGSLDYNLSTPAGCDRTALTSVSSSLLAGSEIKFKNGEANLTNFSYPNIGDIAVNFIDTSWTLLDQNLTDATMSDCIVGSSTNTPDATTGKVGCNIESNSTFRFSPARFLSDMSSLNNFANGFTYISNDKNMSAPFDFKIKAVLDDNSTATNFHHGCFATDVNYTVNLGAIANPRFFDLNNSIMDNNSSTGEFSTTEGNFTTGVTSVKIGLNVKRDVRVPLNPFTINSLDIGLDVDDNGTYNIHGNGFKTTVDQNATFYYGRVNIPDIETASDNIDVRAYYEVYCGSGCDKTKYPLAKGAESGDSIYWYINNPSHTIMNQGTFNTSGISAENGTTCASSSFSGFNASLGSIKAPHRDRISYKPSNWLIFNKYNKNADTESFNITFYSSSSNWAGKGKKGFTMEQNISKRNAKKMDW